MESYHTAAVLVVNMRLFIRIFCLAILLASSSYSFAENVQPIAFEAEFDLYIKGAKVARMERRFSLLENGNYTYHSRTKTRGLISLIRKDEITENSNGYIADNQIHPVQYRYSHTGTKKERKVALQFDWGKNQITNHVNEETWKMEANAGMLDKLVYQFVIMQDLQKGENSISYTIADGGKIKTYDFEIKGEEIIETPLGELDTVKVTRHKPSSRRETTLWCAKGLNYLPVKVENIEKDGNKTVAVIRSLKGLGYPQQ